MLGKECFVVLAHGSKRNETKFTLDSLIEKVKNKMGVNEVFGAYLQLCDPLLDETLKGLYKDGYRKIKVMPLFLFDGIHVLKDIPECIDELKKSMPGLEVEMVKHIGDDDRIAEIIIDRIKGGK